ncbi:MAG: efflux RND transporter periplasmic adaptor subunit [Gammaproteobacteria bacterium]|nr:efflux RND transporter periplasmic adaptor subunit [Gammaproteobacteria bacterium]MBU1656213.1 efflux RND transporter periplasmic adaptor subunit [Gammaproteobacteria bacterium]MBU1959778.1 efflux RND transporter periplasmic adaptor subunit [Gammaproteobacteria bacterium]
MNRGFIIGIVLCLQAPISVHAQSGQMIETAAAAYLVIPREVLLDGTLEAVNQATISAQTGGQVREILFDVDDYVEQGKVIVSLRDTEQKSQVDQAQGTLRGADARMKEARDDHARIKDVFAKQLVSQADMDRAAAALKAAEARQATAQASLQQAQEQLEYTKVRAPYSGIVTRRHVEVGEVAQPGKPLMTGISLDKLRALVNVPQSLIGPVRAQGRVRVILPDGQSVDAVQLTIFPFADQISNTFKVRVDLPRGTEGLFPGMFVKAAFALGDKRALVIPERAVAYRGEVTGIYVVSQEGRIGFRHIRPGKHLAGEHLAVLAGLDEGERVVLDPIKAGVLLKQQAAEEKHGD